MIPNSVLELRSQEKKSSENSYMAKILAKNVNHGILETASVGESNLLNLAGIVV